MMKLFSKASLNILLMGLLLQVSSLSSAQEPIRIAFMDPLSGTFASVGNSGLKQLQYAAEEYLIPRAGFSVGA